LQENLDAAKLKIQNADEVSFAAGLRACLSSGVVIPETPQGAAGKFILHMEDA
jgi:hypothetical protein